MTRKINTMELVSDCKTFIIFLVLLSSLPALLRSYATFEILVNLVSYIISSHVDVI